MKSRILAFATAGVMCCAGADLRFRPVEGGAFEFDTGVLRGQLRSEGRSIGLLPVIHVPSGTALAHSMGLFSVYRVFSDGRRYGHGLWDWPSEPRLATDGSLEVLWPVDNERPFEVRTVYRWAGPDTLDLEISVKPDQDLRSVELFLAAYFGEPFVRAEVLVKGDRLMAAERANGQWQMFPRNPEAVSLIRDGRWRLPPNPVDWVIQPEFEQPLAVRRDPASGLTAIVMAQPGQCFAVATPEQDDSHRSTYLSLFGRDVGEHETVRTRTRLVILSSADDTKVRELYRTYVRGK